MDENEIESLIQENVASEEVEQNSAEQNNYEQVGESFGSLKIPVKESEDKVQLSVDIQSDDQEFDSRSSVPVQQVQDVEPLSPDFFDVERYVERKSTSVPMHQLQDIEQLSSDALDADRYDEYESSINLENKRGLAEQIESYWEQKDQRFEEQSDRGLEEQQDEDFEQQSSIVLEEQSVLGLEEENLIGLEQQSNVGLDEQSETGVEEQDDIDLEVQSEKGLEEQSDIDFEEQSDIGFEEDICFDEQSYLSSREEKSDSEKIEEGRKSSSVTMPDRQKLVELYQTLQFKESVLLKQSYKLQMRLGARLKSLEKRDYVSIPDKADIEEKYCALLGEIEDMWKTDAEQLERHIRDKKELKLLLVQNQQNLTQMKDDLFSKQKNATLMSINTKTGRHISPEEIEMYFNRKLATDEKVKETRLKYVKEKRRLQKLQDLPIEKDTSPGSENVHFLQYEELRIASETNQRQLEKLAQKKEQLAYLKLRRNEAATRLERLRNHFGILSDQNLMRHYDKLQHDLHSLRIQITGIKSNLNEDNVKK